MNQSRFPNAISPEENTDEFSKIDLDGPTSIGESLASTLYDPAAFALDPKEKAKMEAELAEKERKKALGVFEEVKEDLAFSPHSPRPGDNPFEGKNVGDDADIVNEAPRFCCGLFPLRQCVFTVNILAVVVGILGIGIGIPGVLGDSKLNLEGFKTTDALLLSGTKYMYLACGVGGGLLLLAGIAGIVLANDITFGIWEDRHKSAYFLYQSVLVLLVLSFGILSITAAVAIAVLSNRSIYDQSAWRTSLLKAPDAACDTEFAQSCAGFADSNECREAESTIFIQQKNCPGHFCFDFCQVRTTIENANEICGVCDPEYEWKKCKEFELSLENGNGCERHINSEPKPKYMQALAILGVGFLSGIACICLASFRACCLAPVEE